MRIVPLIAGIPEMLSVAIPFIVMIVWVLNQVFGRLAQQQRNPPRNPVPPQPRPAGGANEEIENFLRRAAQQRAGQQQRAQLQQPASQAAATKRPVPQSPFAGGARERLDTLVEVETVEDAHRLNDGVSAHVSSYLDTREFQKRASKMTNVDGADEAMSEHLQQAFQHKLGQLGGAAQPVTAELSTQQAAAKPASKPAPANALAALLRNPQNIRNAVVLQEIFNRPADRW